MNLISHILYTAVIHNAALTAADELLTDWFADDEASGDCTGGDINLRQGEATIVRSHSGYGRKSYPEFPLTPMGVLAHRLRTLDRSLVPHQHERKFSGARVCRVTFKHLPQPLRSHI